MATMQANGSPVTPTSTVNDGGVMKANGGNIPGAPLSTDMTADTFLGVFASTVISGVNTEGALNGGVFAHNNELPITFYITDELGGLASSALNGPGTDPSYIRNPAPMEVVRTRRLATAIRENKYDYYTGAFESGYPVTAVDPWWEASGGSGVANTPDTAANPTKEVPGLLEFQYGAPNPLSTQYESKTIW